MTIKKAIEKAMEGGYMAGAHISEVSEFGSYSFLAGKLGINLLVLWQETLYDPLFWQCFGKAIGWKQTYTKDDPEWKTMTFEDMRYRTPNALWHRFIDHIAEDKDINSFFENI